jgi:hypothetical protein
MATAQKTPPPVGAIVAASAAATNNTSYAGLIAPGQTVPLSLAGTNFYLSVATAPLWIRTSGQAWSLYQPGTGANVGQFNLVELYNSSANAITFQINCGTASFIDHRAVVPTVPANVFVAATWTGTTGGDSFAADLLDKSGMLITDLKGSQFIAVQRVLIAAQTFPNAAGNNVLTLTAFEEALGILQVQSIPAPGGAIGPPLTLACSGNFAAALTVPGGAVAGQFAASLFEIYQAVLPGSGLLGTPPG